VDSQSVPIAETQKSSIVCPICQGRRQRELYPTHGGQLVRCCDCQVVLFTPRPSQAELDRYYNAQSYYEHYQSSPMGQAVFAQHRYQQLCRVLQRYAPYLLTQQPRVMLDVGCSTGQLLAVAATQGWQIQGMDLSAAAVKQAQEQLGPVVQRGTIAEIASSPNIYDLITLYHVIEHLLDPVLLLRHIYKVLRPGGAVFIETPNIDSLGARLRGKRWSHIIPPEHITYFNSTSLQRALHQAGFQTIQTLTIRPQVIESLAHIPIFLKGIASLAYTVAPLINLGASLQAIALKPSCDG